MCADKNPYLNLGASSFWKSGIANVKPYLMKEIYKKEFNIMQNTKIMKAVSCFAQNISKHLNKKGFTF